MTQRRTCFATLFAALLLVGLTQRAIAQPQAGTQATEVATVAAVVGGAELQRGSTGTWQLAVVGTALFAGDRVRTQQTSRLKLVFQDDSVVDVGPATEMMIGTQIFDQSAREYKSVLNLVSGKIRALVSQYYESPRARYEVETPTAVAGVRGTEFIIQYDRTSDYTDVVGIEDEVRVEGTLGVVGGGVKIGPRMATRVQKGRFPSVPRRIDDALFRQYLEGLELVGTGGRDSLGASHPATRGTLISASDNAATVAGQTAPETGAAPSTHKLTVGLPGLTRAAQLFPDVATNTQPIVDYRMTPPTSSPTGHVKVGF